MFVCVCVYACVCVLYGLQGGWGGERERLGRRRNIEFVIL